MRLIMLALCGALLAWLAGTLVFGATLSVGFLSLALGGVFGAALDAITGSPPEVI